MNAYRICSTCRRNTLAKAQRNGPGQWQSRATFISLSNPRTITDNSTKTATAISDVDNLHTDTAKPLQFRKKRRSTEVRARAANKLESLFQSGLNASAAQRSQSTDIAQSVNLDIYERLETLKQLLAKENEPIEDIWRFFVSNFGIVAEQNGSRAKAQPMAFKSVAGNLFHRLIKTKQKRLGDRNLPGFAQIMMEYISLGLRYPLEWDRIMSDSIRKLSEQILNTSQNQNLSTASPIADLDYAIEDLLGAWLFVCKTYGGSRRDFRSPSDGLLDGWSSLPAYPKLRMKQNKNLGRLEQALLALLPLCPDYHAKTMATAAVATFALLMQEPFSGTAQTIRQHPFVLAISRLLVAVRPSPMMIDQLFKTQSIVSISKDMKLNWDHILDNAEELVAKPDQNSKIQYLTRRLLGFSPPLIHQRLERALVERDLPKMDQLWEETKAGTQSNITNIASETSSDALGAASTANSSKDSIFQPLYHHFILAYMGLRQPNRAIGVWNHMIEASMSPTLSSWNAMLQGSRTARSMSSLEGVWAKLLASGVKPDMGCWTTRISGMIDCGKPELAIHALDEMGRIWTQAAKKSHITEWQSAGDIDSVVKPSIETINAVIAGLLRYNHRDAANRVLAWGGTFGIQPDIITFNTLLRALVRGGRIEAVRALLVQMQEHGVQADVATFTTLLEEMLKGSEAQTPEKQTEIVNTVFAEMEGAGVQANPRTYSTVIYFLLQNGSQDTTAVEAVLSRMAAKGVGVSPHIYTMLIEHYFAQERPDLEAVRYIIERIRLSDAVMDKVFWDRVIEGYSRVGETTSAITILGRVDKDGSRVSWWTLHMVVSALVINNEWDLARQVVRNARKDRGGPPPPDVKGIDGQHAFWRYVTDRGLMDT